MRFGIEKGYPNLRRVWDKSADFFALCRPLTLLGAWIAGFFLDILFSKPNIDFIHSFIVGVTLALLQAGGQALNQSIKEEVEIDKYNGKTYRPTVDGRMSLKEGQLISVILFSSGILVAFSLSAYYGLFSMLIAFFAIGYTIPPFRVKRFFILNNIWQGISRGMLPAIYVSLSHNKLGALPIFYGLALAIWVTGAQTSKDFGDEIGDKKFNIRTLPSVLGRNDALFLMTVFMLIGFIMLNIFILYGLLPTVFLIINVLAIPSALITTTLRKQIKLKFAENTAGWVIWYATLGLFYILPSLLI